MTTTPQPAADVLASITITARLEGPGLLLSLATAGQFASEEIDRRFYSIGGQPPADLEPRLFWAPLLADIAIFLGGELTP